MGFLGKKGKKGSRISRIVADLQSPKRGNSLVVETGFPTSLVDLFVKNKDRLKKPPTLSPNKCKKNKKKVVEEKKFIREEDVLVVSDRVPETGFKEEEIEGELGGVEVVSEEEKNVVIKEERVLVLWVFLRVFVVMLVLGLSVKEMVFGVTVSAFVLIFMKFFGRRFVCCLDVAGGGLSGLIVRVLCLFRIVRDGGEEGFVQLGFGVAEEFDAVGLNLRVEEEIQVVEFVARVDGEKGEGKGIPVELDDCGRGHCGVGIVEVDGESNGGQRRGRERGKCGRIRAKIMKKLVPKKYRGGKKGKECKEKESDLGDCVSGCLGDPEVVKEQGDGDKRGLEEEGKLFLSQLVKNKEEEIEVREVNVDCVHGIFCSSTKSLANNSTRVVVEKLENPGKANVDFVILFLAVLTGLVSGRGLAFLLTVGSCLMLKLAGRLRSYADESFSR